MSRQEAKNMKQDARRTVRRERDAVLDVACQQLGVRLKQVAVALPGDLRPKKCTTKPDMPDRTDVSIMPDVETRTLRELVTRREQEYYIGSDEPLAGRDVDRKPFSAPSAGTGLAFVAAFLLQNHDRVVQYEAEQAARHSQTRANGKPL